MNKQELVAAVASAADLTKAQAKAAIDSLCAVTAEALHRGDEVRLDGIGTLATKVTKARETFGVEIPARVTPKFKPSAALRRHLASLPA